MFKNKIALLICISLFLTTFQALATDDDKIDSFDKLLEYKQKEWIAYRMGKPMEIGEHIIFPVLQKIVDYYMLDDHKINSSPRVQKIIDSNQSQEDILLSKLLMDLLETSFVQEKDHLSLKKQKEIIEFLLQYKSSTGSILSNVSLFLNYFYDEKYYSDAAKKIIKDQLLQADIFYGNVFLLFDAAGLNTDTQVIEFVRENSSLCKIWKNRSREWFCLLLLAKWGDSEASSKVYEIAKISANPRERSYQIHYMPFELTIIQQPECAELLTDFMKSDEEYKITVLETTNLGFNALLALSCMFPDILKASQISLEQFKSDPELYFIQYSDKIKSIKKIDIATYPAWAKSRIWR